MSARNGVVADASDPNTRWLVDAFQRHASSVHTLARRLLHHAIKAEDIVQDTFVQGWHAHHQIRDPSATAAWLLRIAYRLALRELREREVPTDPMTLPLPPDENDPATITVRVEERRQLLDALASLPVTLRAAVVLRDVDERPMREVAHVLGISASAAKMRVHRGRRALQQRLTPPEGRA